MRFFKSLLAALITSIVIGTVRGGECEISPKDVMLILDESVSFFEYFFVRVVICDFAIFCLLVHLRPRRHRHCLPLLCALERRHIVDIVVLLLVRSWMMMQRSVAWLRSSVCVESLKNRASRTATRHRHCFPLLCALERCNIIDIVVLRALVRSWMMMMMLRVHGCAARCAWKVSKIQHWKKFRHWLPPLMLERRHTPSPLSSSLFCLDNNEAKVHGALLQLVAFDTLSPAFLPFPWTTTHQNSKWLSLRFFPLLTHSVSL